MSKNSKSLKMTVRDSSMKLKLKETKCLSDAQENTNKADGNEDTPGLENRMY